VGKKHLQGRRQSAVPQLETNMFKLATLVVAAALVLTAGPVMAANFEVQMLNKGQAGIMVFEPALLHVAQGDTVTFLAADKGHNAETIRDLIPEGADAFKGKINEEFVVTFDVPGAYAIKCLPHFAMGMVMAIIVGDAPANLDAVKGAKLPKKAKERLDAALASGGF
jgi:pseudoazurin